MLAFLRFDIFSTAQEIVVAPTLQKHVSNEKDPALAHSIRWPAVGNQGSNES